MAEGPLYVILDMITLILDNTIGTLLRLLGMSGNLMESLSLVSSVGGGLGLLIVLAVIFVVGFFVFKFLLRSMKTIGMLILALLAVLALLFIGSSFV
jgi:hypothetical protein